MTRLDQNTEARTIRVPSPPAHIDAAVAALPSKGSRNRWRLAGLGIAAGADVALAVPAFDGVLRGWTATSIGCAIAFVIVTVLAAHSSGRELKLKRRALAIVAGSATVGLIAAIFVLRIAAASLRASAVYGGAAQPTNSAANEVPIAIVMAVLMLATSAMAWIDGYITTPRHEEAQLRTVDGALVVAQTEWGINEGTVTRLVEDRDMAQYQLARVPLDLEDALHGLDAAMRELQELARIEIATALGNPPATSELDNPLA